MKDFNFEDFMKGVGKGEPFNYGMSKDEVIEKVRKGEMHWAWGGLKGVEPCQCDKNKHHTRIA